MSPLSSYCSPPWAETKSNAVPLRGNSNQSFFSPEVKAIKSFGLRPVFNYLRTSSCLLILPFSFLVGNQRYSLSFNLIRRIELQWKKGRALNNQKHFFAFSFCESLDFFLWFVKLVRLRFKAACHVQQLNSFYVVYCQGVDDFNVSRTTFASGLKNNKGVYDGFSDKYVNFSPKMFQRLSMKTLLVNFWNVLIKKVVAKTCL